MLETALDFLVHLDRLQTLGVCTAASVVLVGILFAGFYVWDYYNP